MPYTDLRDWIQQLDKAGELRRIKEPISPCLEMAEIADRTGLHVDSVRRIVRKVAGQLAALSGSDRSNDSCVVLGDGV